MKYIDAHLHINYSGFRKELIDNYLKDPELEFCLLHTWQELRPSIPSLYQPLPLEDILEIKSQYPDRLVPFFAPDPTDPNWQQLMESALANGVKGCGELKVNLKWSDHALDGYLDFLNKKELPLLIHMELPRRQFFIEKRSTWDKVLDKWFNNYKNGVTRYYTERLIRSTLVLEPWLDSHLVDFAGYLYDFEGLEQRVKEFPNIKFIGHGPHFWNNLGAQLSPKHTYQQGTYHTFGLIDKLLSTYSNFFCDISGYSGWIALNRNHTQTKIFLSRHADKVFYGTDNVFLGQREFIKSLSLGSEIESKIFYKNIVSLIF